MKLNNNLNASYDSVFPESFCSKNIAFGKFIWDNKIYYGIIIFVPIKKEMTEVGILQSVAP